jgi:hypothetical protein
LPTSSAFLRAVRTSSVSSPICLPVLPSCLPAFLTCLATPFRPDPVPGIGTPRTRFGFPLSRLPRRTPPTSPAAAVATPVTTWVFDGDPFEFDRRAFPRDRDELPRLRDDPDPDRADAVRRLDALVPFDPLREPEFVDLRLELADLPRELVDLVLLGELVDLLLLVLLDLLPELAWAITPPLGRCPRALEFAYPD